MTMKKRTLAFVIGLIPIAGILSCSEPVTPTPYTYTQVFTGAKDKTWKVQFVEQTLKGAIVDRFTIDCASDDQFTLYANAERTEQIDNGSKKCGTEATTMTDSWGFSNSSATLIILLPFLADSSLPMIVREANKNTMVLEIFFDATNTESYRVHFTATHEE